MIVGMTVLKNATRMGYPWVETILTVLPICNHFHIGEGYSEDDTWDILVRLKEKYGDKISLSRYEWPVMETGFAIGAATNDALNQIRHLGGKVLYVQGDELWHPESLAEMKRLAEEDYDAYSIQYLHLEHNCQQVQEGAGYQRAIRMVANKDTIVAHRDAWTFEGYERCLGVHSLPHPLVHCNYCFWDNVPIKKREQADKLYQDLGHYQQAAELAEQLYSDEPPQMFKETGSPFIEHLSPLFVPMLGQRKYYVREELLV